MILADKSEQIKINENESLHADHCCLQAFWGSLGNLRPKMKY